MAERRLGFTDNALMKTAELTFLEDGTPKSSRFNDFYFSDGQGPAETQFVFIEQNNLITRFSQLPPGGHFTIAETGFGTGLNFLVAWQLFLQHAPRDARLTFASCEKFPLSKIDLSTTHQLWPTLSQLAVQLQTQYPPALEGFHLAEFDRVSLILMFDDASHALADFSASVDAWFLDGFSPSKNPEMWQPELFYHMHRMSHRNTTMATFTSARLVRDGLKGAGFQIEKIPGYGLKRNMCKGTFVGMMGPLPIGGWPSSELPTPRANKSKNIAVIGAGIAGTSTAEQLVKRGYNVTLIDKNQPATGGSGNSQGAIYAKLPAQVNETARFYAQALVLAQQLLQQLPHTVPHEACGLVQLVHNERELKRMNTVIDAAFIPPELACKKTERELKELTGIDVSNDGLWFKNGGWVSPKHWTRHLANTQGILHKFNCEVTSLTSLENGWQLITADNENLFFDQVVVCTAVDTLKYEQTKHLPLSPIAGQITQLEQDNKNAQLKAVICTDRYVMPTNNNLLTIGSTFRIKSTDTRVNDDDHQENIRSLKARVPALLSESALIKNGRAAVRCTSRDYCPMVGNVADPAYLAETFTIAVQKKRSHQLPPAAALHGLWVNVAHGSKGLCSAPLSARMLAAMIAGEPIPVQASVMNHISPNRFEVRSMSRAKRIKQ